MKDDARKLGIFGEEYTKKYLLENNFTILAMNYHTKYGELDLIAQKNEKIYFIEVKTRKSLKFGYPVEAYTKSKQEKIIKSAMIYLSTLKVKKSFQFNLVSIVIKDNNEVDNFTVYENAISY
jgi:putative endonuclease